ncbi:MAG: phosphoribosylamine--glycine ligase [Acidobacteria bacterium]|nr:phosphoribosylamine--glycine ligase [Acidobacteriota bacterium]
MKILVIGGGGREHALVWKLRSSPLVEQLYCVPGNAGISQEAVCRPGDILSPSAMAALAEEVDADFTVVGPEAPLVAGIVDEFHARNLAILGPTRAAAQLEGSKVFAKQFLRDHGIPTAEFAVLESPEDVAANIDRFGFPVVLKADGLAAGKGVLILREAAEARAAAEQMLAGKVVGEAGHRAVLERFLPGEEVSFIVLSDGERYYALPPTQDHKAVYDDDQGPNTGGMGAYCNYAILSDEQRSEILARIVEPTLEAMRRQGCPYQGFLYFGLMMTGDGPHVLEFNVRLGDPETQPLLFRLDSDLLPLLEGAARGRLPDSAPDGAMAWLPGPTVCVVMASAGYPGSYATGKEIFGIDQAESLGAKVFHAGTKFADGRLVTAGGRVLGVTATGEDLPTTIDNAYAAVARVRFEGMHYRRDIGVKGLRRISAAFPEQGRSS